MADKKISELNSASAVYDADDFALVQDAETKQVNASVVKAYVKDGLSKSDVGLGNVDNTSDLNKPISTATQSALDGKEDADATILKEADIGVTVQAYDATILTDSDIGVAVQAYDSTILNDADIGVNVQAYSANLDEYAAVNPTAAGLALLDDADAAAQRTTLGLVIGTNVQAYDSDLTAWAGKTAPTGDAVGTSDAQTLTNKTISGASNTLSNIGNASLTNSSITINGTAVSLGGTRTLSASDVGAEPADATILKSAAIGVSVQAYDADIPTISASQAEMEAGTETANRSMSPLRVRQAILATSFSAQGAPNDIGTAGTAGFGVGICPGPLPAGVTPVSGGTFSPYDPDYGNYQFTDGSVMVWIPAFFYKWTSTNVVDIKKYSAYASVAAANSAGYALHRAFYDGGEQKGFFMDKYLCSNNGGVFSSIRHRIPCDTDGSQSGIAALTGVGTNNYGYVQKAASQRGTNFHSASIFMHKALALLSLAHAQASSNTTYCAWYDATNNFPKGCNNNALGDANDGTLSFISAGHGTYPNKPLAGSANLFAKTTHNGQMCGICDLNGSMWEVAFGLTSDGSNYYALKTSKRLRDLIGTDASSATSLFGSSGISTNYDSLGATIGQATASNSYKTMGSASQVLSTDTTGTNWQAAGAGIPIAVGGSNAFGNDGFWDYRPNEMCPIVGAAWASGSLAGVWALGLDSVRSSAYGSVGGRAALFL